MIILNLGCGTTASKDQRVVNIDWSLYLRIKSNPILKWAAMTVLDTKRKQRLLSLPENIMVHDLRKGVPFGTESVDVVYHSHLLEHIDRADAVDFLLECNRVLRRKGKIRIVVPDLHMLAVAYMDSFSSCKGDSQISESHDQTISQILEQCVRRESGAVKGLPRGRKRLETFLFGDARARGETHQWMYDEVNLSHILRLAGFENPNVVDSWESGIEDWQLTGLDVSEHGEPRKSCSLYIEAEKP